MLDNDTLMTVFTGAQAVGIVVSLLYINQTMKLQNHQLASQQRAVSDQQLALGFGAYQAILRDYSQLMWKSAEDERLRDVWTPWPDERRAELDAAQRARHERGPVPGDELAEHGAWLVMTPDERLGYRFTRTGLELFEQAYQVHRLGWMSEDTWRKWLGTFDAWARNRYAGYVLEDHRERFLAGFAELLADRRVRAAADG